MFTEQDIKNEMGKRVTYEKGRQLANNGSVLNLYIEESDLDDRFYINGIVLGSYDNTYEVWILINGHTGEIEDYACDCPAFLSYTGMCKHCAALALEFLAQQKNSRQPDFLKKRLLKTDTEILNLIEGFALRKRLNEQTPCGNIELTPQLHETYSSFYFSRDARYTLTFKIGSRDGRDYVLKNISDFVNRILKEEMYSYGKQLSFVHSKNIFTEKAWKYVAMMEMGVEQNMHTYQSVGKELPLTPDLWDIFFEIVKGDSLEFDSNTSRIKNINFIEKDPPVKLFLNKEEDSGFQIKIPPVELIYGNIKQYVRIKNTIYPCSEELSMILSGFLELADEKTETTYHISSNDMPAFCGSVLPELENLHVLDKKDLDLSEFQPKEAEIFYYLDEENGRVTLKTLGSYGEVSYNLLNPPSFANEYHDRTKELLAVNLGRSYFPNEDTYEKILYFSSDDHDRMYHLLSTGIQQFEEHGTVYATDKIKGRKLISASKTQVGVALKSGLLELSVQNTSFSPEELTGILDNYRKKKKYYRMKSGDYLPLEENALTTVAELLDGLGISAQNLTDGKIEVPQFRACYVDQVLKQNDGHLQVKRDADYKSIIRDMKNVEDSDFQVPATLNQVLRGYQKLGFRWLNTLAKLGFGGILADDMGLGKTLQVISYLLYRKQTHISENASLVVCPASLVYNWEHEFKRFAPELTVSMLVGNAQQRETRIQSTNSADIWITSYDMLKRDVSLYRECHFDTEIIDEAQNIKNQGTLAAKAVKKIHADIRFALTGTPIENRLSELWSIFDYLMPGILGTYEKFRKGYELPIVQNQDTKLTERLKKMISPFILRRVKKEVLKELPDKIEQTVYSEMEPEQRKIYEAHALQLMETLKKQSHEDIQKEKLQILAELTRLRQICCSPKMLYENYKETSGKLSTCLELVNQAIEGNHKVLIFSQFTSIFPLLGERLKQMKVPYYELTGQTPKEERIRLVKEFNSNEVPVFLISLKAGGTGLNLTAASIVIHFDPWWNLAAQNQATDRAHRIGQDKEVVVFKLIAQNTIEEKIIGLQEQKQKLASQILEGEGVAISTLTKEDFMNILEF